jgi:hypothetical protein
MAQSQVLYSAHSQNIILINTVLLIILVSLPFRGLSPTDPRDELIRSLRKASAKQRGGPI